MFGIEITWNNHVERHGLLSTALSKSKKHFLMTGSFSDLRLPHSWRSILQWCFHGSSKSWSGLMQRLSLLVDIFFRGSDFGYNFIIQSLECYNMGRVCQTHTCRLHKGFHFIRFASHISFFQFIWHVHTCSIFSLFAVAVFGTPARLLHVCLGSVVLALFLKTTFKFFCSFSMDLITNSIWNTASEFEYALDSFTPIC